MIQLIILVVFKDSHKQVYEKKNYIKLVNKTSKTKLSTKQQFQIFNINSNI